MKTSPFKTLTYLCQFLFSDSDRLISLTSLLFSLISLVLTAITWQFPEKIPQLIIIRDVVVVCTLFLASGVILQRHFRLGIKYQTQLKHNEYIDRLIVDQLCTCHDQAHKFRDKMFREYHDLLVEDIAVTAREKDVFDKICHSLTSEIKKLFVSYFQTRGWDISDDISVSVKLTLSYSTIFALYEEFGDVHKRQLEKKGIGEKWVVTAFRDPETFESRNHCREVGERIYDPDKNTAFHNIINLKQPFYYCNDLNALGNNYMNENPKWSEQYNSTAVIPIRYHNEHLGHYSYFGLIAVDSLNPDRYELYNDRESRYILGHAADLLANYFLCLSLFKLVGGDHSNEPEQR